MRQTHLLPWVANDWERALARAVSASWALFWAWFGFAAGAAESASLAEIFAQTLPGLIFLGATAFAWHRPLAGGIVLIVMGSVVCAAYWASAEGLELSRILAVESLLALPPVLAGFCFLSCHQR
jgi:hypothetical protein